MLQPVEKRYRSFYKNNQKNNLFKMFPSIKSFKKLNGHTYLLNDYWEVDELAAIQLINWDNYKKDKRIYKPSHTLIDSLDDIGIPFSCITDNNIPYMLLETLIEGTYISLTKLSADSTMICYLRGHWVCYCYLENGLIKYNVNYYSLPEQKQRDIESDIYRSVKVMAYINGEPDVVNIVHPGEKPRKRGNKQRKKKGKQGISTPNLYSVTGTPEQVRSVLERWEITPKRERSIPTGRKNRPHPRKDFWKRVRVGKGRKEFKWVHIPPVNVNGWKPDPNGNDPVRLTIVN